MKRLTPSVFAAVAVVAVGVAVASHRPAFAAVPSPLVRAPAGTAALATAAARAALRMIRLPPGSRRLARAPRGLGAGAPDFASGYPTVKLATSYWTLPSAGVRSLLDQAPSMSRWSASGPGGLTSEGVEIALHPRGRWLGPGWLGVDAAPAGVRWEVVIEAAVVWTPSRLEVPDGVRSVLVRRASDGAVLARVGDPARTRAISAVVDSLAVDDAVNAVYSCPAFPVAGYSLTFAGARGRPVATAATGSCPADLTLRVPGYAPQRLILGDLSARLQAILRITLPPAV